MYYLIRDSKNVGSADTYDAAIVLAEKLSKEDKGVSRTIDGVTRKGSIVSVWSGPLVSTIPGVVRDVTKHVSFAAGYRW